MPADIESLLAEAPWLARLARSLTGNAAEADDIVQDTYAAALRSPPDANRPLRPWLRTVAVNLARMRHRGRARRDANEAVVEVQVDPARTPEHLLERAQLERRLVELVIALDEPFRTTVLLRYREGLSAEQIARRLDIPAGTIRSRLKTALDRLRRDLDDGEHRRMRALFPPIAPGVGRLMMAKGISKLVLAALALLALLVGGVLLFAHRERAGRAPTSPPVRPASLATTASVDERAAMFAQPGVASRSLRGRVTADGVPVRGATVQLVHAQTSVVLAEVTSASDGVFELGERGPDVYLVVASTPDRVAPPVTVDLRAPALVALELQLAGCSHVRGTVVDGSGAPIAHARIARDNAPIPFAESDANGHYDLCTHFGATTLRYAAFGYQQYLVAVDAAASIRRDVTLIPEATVEGKVLDADDRPVEGAWVVIGPSDVRPDRNAPVNAFTAADGSFRLTGVSPGRNLIAAYAPARRTRHPQELVVGAGQTTAGVMLRLEATAALRGMVVSGGAPVAGARVGIRKGNRDELGVLAITQADGSFLIDRAPRGDVGVYVEDHVVLTPRSVRVGDAPTPVTIDVRPMATIHGRVLRNGSPVAAAQVSCPHAYVFTDAAGAYTCTGVDDGPKELFADLPSGEWGRGVVTVTQGAPAQLDIPITFDGAICGRLVDERGAPVPDLVVQVAERTTGDYGRDTSATDGSFCARKLTGGSYDLTIRAAGRLVTPHLPLAPITLGPSETANVTIAVDAPHLTIAGTVRDPEGAPVVDAIVRLAAADVVGTPEYLTLGAASLVLTDEDGRFTFTGLPAGDYLVNATARDGSAVTRSPVAAGTRDLAITLAAAGRIDGTLAGFTSPPRITVMLTSDAQSIVEAIVDENHFRASGLSPGTYVLMAVTDAREGDTQKIVVRSGASTSVTMTSRGTATILGTARDFLTRGPVAGLRCASFARQGGTMGAVFTGPDEAVPADAQGAFRLLSSAGEINVLCMGAGTAGSRNTTAKRDAATTVDLFTVAIAPNPGTIDAEIEWARPRLAMLVKGGAADSAGLAAGDEIIAVDGRSVAELDSGATMRLVTQRPAGTTAALSILRAGEQRSINVTVRGAN